MYWVKDKCHIIWLITDFKRKSTKSHETIHVVQAKPRETDNKEKKENIPPKLMTLQANSDLLFTFNLFYLIVFHLSFLGGEVITTSALQQQPVITAVIKIPLCQKLLWKETLSPKMSWKMSALWLGTEVFSWYTCLGELCKNTGCIYAIRDYNYAVKAMISAKLLLALNCQDYVHYCTVTGKDVRQKYWEGVIVIPLDIIILVYNKDILLCICRGS